MSKRILITDETSGKIEVDELADGGYAVQFSKNTDEGKVHIHGRINNAMYGRNHWIKNDYYGLLAQRLCRKFEELNHIKVNRILFLEEHAFKKKSGQGRTWAARVKRAPKELTEAWGYWYIMEIRKGFWDILDASQRAALIYHELRHVGTGGHLYKHDVEDWANMISVLGEDWLETEGEIWDLLDENFDWGKPRKQLTLMDYGSNAAKIGG